MSSRANTENHNVSVNIPQELKDALTERVILEERTISQIVRRALIAYLKTPA